jgi:hypothetical protein
MHQLITGRKGAFGLWKGKKWEPAEVLTAGAVSCGMERPKIKEEDYRATAVALHIFKF